MPRKQAAHTLFFPAAALYGALAVPLSVYSLLSANPLLPAFASPLGHAHELLFGYALAVMAGYLITRASRRQILLVFGLWLTGRGLWLLSPGSPLTPAANTGFVALTAYLVVPQFTRSAKKLRNKALGPLIGAICLAPVAFHAARLADSTRLQYLAIQETVLLLALLMLFMGGRILAPAVAGAIEKAGGTLEARVQPRIEGGLMILMAAAILALPFSRPIAGTALILAGILAGVRLLRWRLWWCGHRPDLLSLAAGYAWLPIGLLMIGAAWSSGSNVATATHAITVGALGTLTASVMARIRLLWARRDPAGVRSLPVIATAMTLAATLRIAFGLSPSGLWLAAACWSAGLLILFALLIRTDRTGLR